MEGVEANVGEFSGQFELRKHLSIEEATIFQTCISCQNKCFLTQTYYNYSMVFTPAIHTFGPGLNYFVENCKWWAVESLCFDRTFPLRLFLPLNVSTRVLDSCNNPKFAARKSDPVFSSCRNCVVIGRVLSDALLFLKLRGALTSPGSI